MFQPLTAPYDNHHGTYEPWHAWMKACPMKPRNSEIARSRNLKRVIIKMNMLTRIAEVAVPLANMPNNRLTDLTRNMPGVMKLSVISIISRESKVSVKWKLMRNRMPIMHVAISGENHDKLRAPCIKSSRYLRWNKESNDYQWVCEIDAIMMSENNDFMKTGFGYPNRNTLSRAFCLRA